MLVAPGRVRPWVGASGLLPHGRGTHLALRDMVHTLHCFAYRETVPGGQPSALPYWVDRGQTWIVTLDYDSGQRVIFGSPGAPPARLAEAVVASCSIPGWYEPVVIGGRRYIDGGVRSATSLDALAQSGIEDVFVVAPMASTVADRPRKPVERLERRLRGWITLTLLREVRALRRLGARVTVITPGPEDLAVMGVNLMDPRRRRLVLETSLRTSRAALRVPGEPHSAVA
jgi:NTE family protein